jgi:nucleoside-diphosphate-sugar epimerase
MPEPIFLTGALGCIGAWTVKLLIERGDVPVIFDQSIDRRRLHDLMDETALDRARFVTGDITDGAAVEAALRGSGARKVIHLAGLQVPACRADPALGARVNVLGTINVFEGARRAGIERVAYASSAAVYGLTEDGGTPPPDETAACEPLTHYGVFKRANEGNARIFWLDHRLSSVGLRPLTVYGVGRDQGLTSDPTRALKAAILGRPFHIRFSGATDYIHARDAAAAFLAAVDRGPPGAYVFNLHGKTAEISQVVSLIEHVAGPKAQGLITYGGPRIPIPPELRGEAVGRALGHWQRTSLEDGFRETAESFRRLHAEGRLWTGDLE